MISIEDDMTPEQDLTEKLTSWGYTNVEIQPEEGIPMLYINEQFICGVSYALVLTDEQLKAFVDETVGAQ